jgi:glutaminyl-tRNA synthetase
MAVLDPVRLVIDNYPEGQVEQMEIENNPEDPEAGSRTVPFSGELWIEREDFMEDPPKKFFRLGPGRVVRLKGAYIIKCEDFKKGADGNISEIHASYLPESKSGNDTSGMKVKGTIHWLSASQAKTAEIRLYDRLFRVEDPAGAEGDFTDQLNPDSLQTIPRAFIEPSLAGAGPGEAFQFLRKGYFCVDRDATPDKQVFNRTVTLRDTWAKEKGKPSS